MSTIFYLVVVALLLALAFFSRHIVIYILAGAGTIYCGFTLGQTYLVIGGVIVFIGFYCLFLAIESLFD